MSRNIKMKRPKFEGNRKEQVAQAKERRVALLQRAKQKQAQPSAEHAPQVKAAPQSNQQVQHLERQIASLKQRLNQQTAQAARQAQSKRVNCGKPITSYVWLIANYGIKRTLS